MPLSTAFHDIILAHFFNEVAHGVVGPTKVRLHDGDPGAAGTANEVDTGDWTNYVAQDVETNLTDSPFWDVPEASTGSFRKVVNDDVVDYGTATIVTPVLVTHFSVFDSSGTPKFLGSAALTTPKTINNGDPVSFPAGALTIELGPA
jgi:hypothetical protein